MEVLQAQRIRMKSDNRSPRWKCGLCGHVLMNGHRYCGHCGALMINDSTHVDARYEMLNDFIQFLAREHYEVYDYQSALRVLDTYIRISGHTCEECELSRYADCDNEHVCSQFTLKEG